MFGPMKEVVRGRRFSSDEEVTGEMHNWLKTQKTSFLTKFKEIVKTLNAETGALKLRGITLKINVSLVSSIFKINVFFKSPFIFDLPSCFLCCKC
jgi:hypothetical protein